MKNLVVALLEGAKGRKMEEYMLPLRLLDFFSPQCSTFSLSITVWRARITDELHTRLSGCAIASAVEFEICMLRRAAAWVA